MQIIHIVQPSFCVRCHRRLKHSYFIQLEESISRLGPYGSYCVKKVIGGFQVKLKNDLSLEKFIEVEG